MRYRLRTLLIVLALTPAVLAGVFVCGKQGIARWQASRRVEIRLVLGVSPPAELPFPQPMSVTQMWVATKDFWNDAWDAARGNSNP